jgi:hypothetical protein
LNFRLAILFITTSFLHNVYGQSKYSQIDFFGKKIQFSLPIKQPTFNDVLSEGSIKSFFHQLDYKSLQPILKSLLEYKADNNPDDWLYYQAVRKVAQFISPKAENYYRYTFYKWWFLVQSGYDSRLTYSGNQLLFYVQSDEKIYNIPSRIQNGKQYVCLNYHDYGNIDFDKNKFTEVALTLPENVKPFSYKITHLPDFNEQDYTEKKVQFNYYEDVYQFKIKVNPQVKNIFTNYPVVDYELQCNMPLSQSTYQSLIPSLKKEIGKMSEKDGVDFLMRFTRYAFLFKPDFEVFGGEKRMSPEQTLLYDYSDCEDRTALFFYLVKEFYNLPMLVLTYPKHVTLAVNFNKPFGKTIAFNGLKYSICEPSSQRVDLRIGQLLPELSKKAYEIAYVYMPVKK